MPHALALAHVYTHNACLSACLPARPVRDLNDVASPLRGPPPSYAHSTAQRSAQSKERNESRKQRTGGLGSAVRAGAAGFRVPWQWTSEGGCVVRRGFGKPLVALCKLGVVT